LALQGVAIIRARLRKFTAGLAAPRISVTFSNDPTGLLLVDILVTQFGTVPKEADGCILTDAGRPKWKSQQIQEDKMMNRLTTLSNVTAFVFTLFVFAATGQATDISGTISSTLTISNDSRLVGDVNCSVALLKSPCIVFGANGITLSLQGHTITGPVVDPPTNCSLPTDSTFGVGIEVNGKNDVTIQGPGVIQNFECR
jgi:hypothetical protein